MNHKSCQCQACVKARTRPENVPDLNFGNPEMASQNRGRFVPVKFQKTPCLLDLDCMRVAPFSISTDAYYAAEQIESGRFNYDELTWFELKSGDSFGTESIQGNRNSVR